MTDSEIKNTCKPVLDNKDKDNDQVVEPIISSKKDIIKSFYEEVGEALEYLDKCDTQSDLSSANSADINEVKNMFEHIFLPDDRSQSEEILQII